MSLWSTLKQAAVNPCLFHIHNCLFQYLYRWHNWQQLYTDASPSFTLQNGTAAPLETTKWFPMLIHVTLKNASLDLEENSYIIIRVSSGSIRSGGDVYFRLCFRKISTDFCYLGCDLGEIQKVHSRLFKQCFSQMVCYLSIQLKLRTRRIRFGSKNNSWVKTAGAQHFKHCSFWRQMTWGQIVIGVW